MELVMDIGAIEIDFIKITDDNGASYEVDLDLSSLTTIQAVEMSRDDLKQFRNMIHNLLLDLNKELNYED